MIWLFAEPIRSTRHRLLRVQLSSSSGEQQVASSVPAPMPRAKRRRNGMPADNLRWRPLWQLIKKHNKINH